MTPEEEPQKIVFDGAEYRAGEILQLTVTGVVVATDEYGLALDCPSLGRLLVQGTAFAWIKRVRPAQGKPMPGEIWRDSEGREWFVCRDDQMIAPKEAQHAPDFVNGQYGPLVRVYAPTPAETEGEEA